MGALDAEDRGHSLIVTVVPVASFRFKPRPGGTVKLLSTMLVHLTALATSVLDIRTGMSW